MSNSEFEEIRNLCDLGIVAHCGNIKTFLAVTRGPTGRWYIFWAGGWDDHLFFFSFDVERAAIADDNFKI